MTPTAVNLIDMNPEGLSAEAQARIAAHGGSKDDLPLPSFADQADVAAWRQSQHEAWGEDSEAGEAKHQRMTIGGVECLTAGPQADRSLIWFHGGGFCLGSPGTDIPITARLAKVLPVVSVDYSLAPERPFPAALDDALAAYRELSQEGPVSLAGVSSGANLAVGVALWAAEQGLARPESLALLSPRLNFDTAAPLDPLSRAYLTNTNPSDARVSPLRASDKALTRLPPTLIQVAATEALHDDAVAFAKRIGPLRVEVTVQVWQGLWHAWHYHRELPEAHDAVDRAANFLAST